MKKLYICLLLLLTHLHIKSMTLKMYCMDESDYLNELRCQEAYDYKEQINYKEQVKHKVITSIQTWSINKPIVHRWETCVPFIWASTQNKELFNLMLKFDYVDVNIRNEEGVTALISMVKYAKPGTIESIRQFLSLRNPLTDLADETGKTALSHAINRLLDAYKTAAHFPDFYPADTKESIEIYGQIIPLLFEAEASPLAKGTNDGAKNACEILRYFRMRHSDVRIPCWLATRIENQAQRKKLEAYIALNQRLIAEAASI